MTTEPPSTPRFVIRVDRPRKASASTVAVADVSLEVFEGEVFGLVGPNGAGKTTTMECVEGNRTSGCIDWSRSIRIVVRGRS